MSFDRFQLWFRGDKSHTAQTHKEVFECLDPMFRSADLKAGPIGFEIEDWGHDGESLKVTRERMTPREWRMTFPDWYSFAIWYSVYGGNVPVTTISEGKSAEV